MMPQNEPLLTVLDTADSTNNYALQQLNAQLANHGSAYTALEQTAGRGQRGNTWLGQKGKNIALSVVLQTNKEAACNQFPFSAAMALAARAFFETECGKPVKIKWPNDIYSDDRKAGGILIDNKIAGNRWNWAVVGVGININQTIFDKKLPNPVSLKQITGKEYDVIELAKKLHLHILTCFERWQKEDEALLIREFNSYLYKQNAQVKLKKGQMVFKTVIKEVTITGKLITEDAMPREFEFGEVEWIL